MQATPISPTADAQAIAPVESAPANAPSSDGLIHIKDANGRDIGISQELDVLLEMRLIKMLGSNNGNYLYLCSQLARVATLGGEKIATPNSEREFEALVVRLGRPGMNAVSGFFTTSEVSAVGGGDEGREATKKS